MKTEARNDHSKTPPVVETEKADVDLNDDEVLDTDTTVDVIEYLGDYESIEAYLQNILADLVDPAIVWILDHLDYWAVQARCEEGGCRYFREGTAIYVTRSFHG
jgi:hypothetical protein